MRGATSRLGRLAAMDGTQILDRLGMTARRELDWLAWSIRRPAWRRRDLVHVLAPDGDLAGARRAAAAGHWAAAHAAIVHHVASRRQRFVLHPASWKQLTTTIAAQFPGVRDEARSQAEAILAGRYRLLGYRNLSFESASVSGEPSIDWHRDPVHDRRAPSLHWSRVPFLDPSVGDHKIVWELNRQQHWLTLGRAFWLTGQARYRRRFVQELESWLAANPPHTGINWASMLEIGLRSISWIWALHFFSGPGIDDRGDREPAAEPWAVDLLVGLHRQLSLVAAHLSTYFSPNTHLLGEGLALYVAGCGLPELRGAPGWASRGRAILLDGIRRQVCADGGHVERSMHYHRYTLDFYLLATLVARLAGDEEAAARFAEAAGRLAAFAATVADARHRLPHFGDDDGGMLFPACGRCPDDITDSLAVAAVVLDRPNLAPEGRAEEALWLTGRPVPHAGRRPARRSVWLEDTGYVVCHSARGDHLVMDVGPLGFLNGGHAHADALSVTLAIRGLPFVIDPGTGCYTVNPTARDRFRSTMWHNTLTLDGRSQSTPDGPFHWKTAARGAVHAWRSSPRLDCIDASHDGYAPAMHRRVVLSRPGLWLIVDWIVGAGTHDATLRWHLDPSWTARGERGGRVHATHPQGGDVWLLSSAGPPNLLRGMADEEGAGWTSPIYGRVVPAATIRSSGRTRDTTARLTAILDMAEIPTFDTIGDDWMDLTSGGASWRLQTPFWSETILARRPDTTVARGALWAAAGFATDAALVCVREASGRPHAEIAVVDGRRVWQEGRGWWLDHPAPLSDVLVVAHSNGQDLRRRSRSARSRARLGPLAGA
jgi:hypothetical protein